MLNEQQLQQLPNGMEYRLRKLNEDTLEKLGQRIKDIGELLPTDAHRLEQLKDYGADVDDIAAELARITSRNVTEIYQIFDTVAAENVAFLEKFYEASGNKFIPYAENKELQNLVRAIAKQTADEFVNMSRATGFMIRDPVTGQKVFTGLSRTYQQVIDKAVTAISTGVSDYQSEMRSVLRELADSGLRTQYGNPKGSAGKVVDYASGYHRRLDTSARQNLLWGVKTCNQSITTSIGDKFGADGYEVDYHSNPRPTHAAMGGKQYSAGRGITVDGVYYPPFSDVEDLLSEYGCLHFRYPIVIGISSPSYSEEKLAQLKAQDEKTFEFEGKNYTGYDATQVQRKLETAMRNAQDRHIIAKASGDDFLAMKEQLRINQLASKYKEFSDKAGLSTKMERAKVSGYRSIKIKSDLTKSNYRDKVINRTQPLTIDSGRQGKHILGHNNYIDGRSYMMASDEDIQKLVNTYSGTGDFVKDRKGLYANKELVHAKGYVGVNIDIDGNQKYTDMFYIHYSKKGTHVVPTLKQEG